MAKIAVITPYYKEPLEWLRQCHESVKMQGADVKHYFVADGFHNQDIDAWDVSHVILPNSHGDNGNTPRAIGSLLAAAEGCEFIAFLDADNWFHPNHLHSLVELHKNTGADICCSLRTIHDLKGMQLAVELDRDEAIHIHVDTSCFLIHKNAFSCLDIWLKMPKELSPIGDRIFLAGLVKKNYQIAHTGNKTVAFRTQYLGHYLAANVAPPSNAKDDVFKIPYEWLLSIEGVRKTTESLGFYPL